MQDIKCAILQIYYQYTKISPLPVNLTKQQCAKKSEHPGSTLHKLIDLAGLAGLSI